MNFYIALRLENFEQVRFVANIMKNNGWTHTYDWTAHGSVKSTNTETLKDIGLKEFR